MGKNNMISTVTVVVVVVLAGVTRAMPIDPEPRQFVYQPGSPSVRLYPVHFENYLKSSSGRFHMTGGQGFLLNMLPSEIEKDQPSTDEAKPAPPPTPTTTTTTTTSTTTTTATSTATSTSTMSSEHPAIHMTTMEPMVMVEMTQRPEMKGEEEDVSSASLRTESPNEHDAEVGLDAASDGNEGTEMTPTMVREEEDMEAATETPNAMAEEETLTLLEDAMDIATEEMSAAAVATAEEEAPVTEMMPAEETATEVPSLREPATDLI
ncbi:uncharacterized protein LOC126997693 isoform X2 [Eriocheir sinensis]|uniref:uncharacterized protein LOC126997693 isoform X1 n=1 Tax=Eriocheir sinensis TaxID=95602 RepID=UPI0021CABE64|nr:uncharacterized protein LOC126997693 isoform X1 [Eriocheir sinensis]XP_050714877.1 uncharacterized protein LOC126997693 isoform X2 [Eriocheir sinensis]